jgi:hypothetical protein
MKASNKRIRLNVNRRTTPSKAPRERAWSNQELKKFTYLFGGDIVNISGWEDKDKEGGYYQDYFPKARSYKITNYTPNHSSHHKNEIHLDLTKKLPKNLENKFDVVLSHTNLEHIFDIFAAFGNQCKMSRDIVIVVVPFIQLLHENDEYKDYWRFTPSALRELYWINGFHTIYESYNNDGSPVTYLLFVGSRSPNKWRMKMPKYSELYQIADWAS